MSKAFYMGVFLGALMTVLPGRAVEGGLAQPPSFLQEVDKDTLSRKIPWYRRIFERSFSDYEEIPVLERHKKLKGVHPDLVKIIDVASRRVELVVFEGVRTIEKQIEYVEKGKSWCDPRGKGEVSKPKRNVRYNCRGRHLDGFAIDVVFKNAQGKVVWSREQAIATLKYLRGIGDALGIRCVFDGSSWSKGLDVSNNKMMDGFHLYKKKKC